jgi:hypothetical protein
MHLVTLQFSSFGSQKRRKNRDEEEGQRCRDLSALSLYWRNSVAGPAMMLSLRLAKGD